MVIRKENLIQNPKNHRPHVVLLGAGASRASFPNGDTNAKRLPVMKDLVEILDLSAILKENGIDSDSNTNFESLYSKIGDEKLKKDIESKILKYLSNLELPSTATYYDRLLLSLRKKDAIFTFNWDPFLFDAYKRNQVASLPEIFFLHGNVRIGACHSNWGKKGDLCPTCGQQFVDVPLLYPIREKDYFNSSQYTKSSWDNAKLWFANAFTITIFGYSAPISDIEAINLLELAWFEKSDRTLEHFEVIDIEDQSLVEQRWIRFTPTHHFTKWESFEQSRLWRWPRRSCESLFYPMSQGTPCEDFPLPSDKNLDNLHKYIKDIAKYESD